MKKEDRAGLYTTVIIHLAVLIVLLATTLGFSIQKENSFVLDFSKLEELERLQAEVERLQKEAEFQQAIHDKLERDLGAAGASIRNVVVDRGSLKDDRGTDADQLYKDAERLARELQGGFEVPDDGFTASLPSKDQGPGKDQKKYSAIFMTKAGFSESDQANYFRPLYIANNANMGKVFLIVGAIFILVGPALLLYGIKKR